MLKYLIRNENWNTAGRLAHSDNIFKWYQVGIILCVGAMEQMTNSFSHLLPCHYFLYGEGNRFHSAESNLQERWFLPTFKNTQKWNWRERIFCAEIEREEKELICWKKKKKIKNNRFFFSFLPPLPPPFFFCFAGKQKIYHTEIIWQTCSNLLWLCSQRVNSWPC